MLIGLASIFLHLAGFPNMPPSGLQTGTSEVAPAAAGAWVTPTRAGWARL